MAVLRSVGGLAHKPWPSITIEGPIFGWKYLSIFIQPAKGFKPVNDKLPGAVGIFSDFALAVGGPAARPVQDALGASRYRAYAARMGQKTIPTSPALLPPQPLFIQRAKKSGVQGRYYGQAAKSLCDGLHAGTARKREHGFYTGRYFKKTLQQVRFTLSLNCTDLDRTLGVFGGSLG